MKVDHLPKVWGENKAASFPWVDMEFGAKHGGNTLLKLSLCGYISMDPNFPSETPLVLRRPNIPSIQWRLCLDIPHHSTTSLCEESARCEGALLISGMGSFDGGSYRRAMMIWCIYKYTYINMRTYISNYSSLNSIGSLVHDFFVHFFWEAKKFSFQNFSKH